MATAALTHNIKSDTRGVRGAKAYYNDSHTNPARAANDNQPVNPYTTIATPDATFRQQQIENAHITARKHPKQRKRGRMVAANENEPAVTVQQLPKKKGVVGKAVGTIQRLKEKFVTRSILRMPPIWVMWLVGIPFFAFSIFAYGVQFLAEGSLLHSLLPNFITNFTDDVSRVIFTVGWGGGVFVGWATLIIVWMIFMATTVWSSMSGVRLFAFIFAAAMYCVPFLQVMPWVLIWLGVILYTTKESA